MMRGYSSLLVVVALSVSMFAGCSWTQKGALVGGAIGAGTGALIAEHSSRHASGYSSLIGLVSGGLAGALIGDLIDQKEMREMEAELERLRAELATRTGDLDAARQRIAELEKQLADCQAEVAALREKLKGLEGVEVKGGEGGIIVLTMLGETLYASGKAELTAKGKATLDQAMAIVREKFPDREMIVRGHTDSQPIRYSGWKSNWELGAARSLGVLHYMMDQHGVQGARISAQTFSFYRPVAPNDTAEGRQQNRRAEIVILPPARESLERP